MGRRVLTSASGRGLEGEQRQVVDERVSGGVSGEVGAECVGIFQSLLATCRLQDVDPYVYLVDVLQRVEEHPASDVDALTPRLWKERFAANPLRSAIDRPVNNAAS